MCSYDNISAQYLPEKFLPTSILQIYGKMSILNNTIMMSATTINNILIHNSFLSSSSSPTSSSPDSGTDPEKPVVYMSPSAHSHGAGSDAPGAIPRYKFDSVPTSGAPARQDTDVDKEPEG